MAIFQRAWPGSDRSDRPARPARGSIRRRPIRSGGRPGIEPEPQAAGGASAGDPQEVRPDAARTLMWSLETGGWSEREAGNLVALLNGLRPAVTGWNEREIEHLRFLRALVETGRLTH